MSENTNCMICGNRFNAAKWNGLYERYAILKEVGSPSFKDNPFGVWEEHDSYGYICELCKNQYIIPIKILNELKEQEQIAEYFLGKNNRILEALTSGNESLINPWLQKGNSLSQQIIIVKKRIAESAQERQEIFRIRKEAIAQLAVIENANKMLLKLQNEVRGYRKDFQPTIKPGE